MRVLKKSFGFTLLEILLVVGIIAVLAAIVIIAINPSKQLAMVRNTERASNLKQIYNAMQQYYIDRGTYPGTIPTTLTEICNTGDIPATTTAVTGVLCSVSGLVNLSDLVPTYLVAIPVDPLGSPVALLTNIAQAETNGVGYLIGVNTNNKVTLQDMAGELGVTHTFGPESSQLCTAFTYSDWSSCANSTQSRTIITSTPTGCTGGTSSTTQACVMSYNVIFNANGGTGSMSNLTMASGTSQNLATSTFTRTNYTFTGWNTVQGGGGTAYADKASFTMQGGDVELWAQWSQNASIPTDGLVSYWSFDGNTNDSVGTNHGINNGATLTTGVKGEFNSAYSFNGSSNEIYLPKNDAGIPVGMGASSLEGWVYLNELNRRQGLFGREGSFGFTLETGNVLTWRIVTTNQGWGSCFVDTVTPTTIGWHHLAGVYNGSQSIFYIDGVQIPINRYCTGTIGNPYSRSFNFGAPRTTDDVFYPLMALNGKVDNVRLYNRALTSEEVSNIYNIEKP